jgi:hypothetical protein
MNIEQGISNDEVLRLSCLTCAFPAAKKKIGKSGKKMIERLSKRRYVKILALRRQ